MGVRYIFGQDGAFRTEPVIVAKNITENGTYDPATEGADGYAPVVVNVEGGGGSSDFSTATVTLTNPPQAGENVEFEQSVYISVFGMVGGVGAFSNIESSISFVLYKGAGYAHFPLKQNFTVTGDIEYDQEYGDLIIRGDGTITIS